MKILSKKVRDKIWVQGQGRLYHMPADLRKAQGATRGEEDQELIAPFSCKVLKIHSKAGQSVKKGDPVVVVEAMKMENILRAERNGSVKKVNAKPGESLAVDAVILEFA